ENLVNHVDNNYHYSYDCNLVPAHRQAGTVVDNHNHNANYSRINYTSNSRTEVVEADVALRIRDEDTDKVKIDREGSLSSQILASPSKEKGNRNNLTVVFGTSGCRNVDVTLLKKRR
nr:hypothetical protein [Tanacetum cinerariifolium]